MRTIMKNLAFAAGVLAVFVGVGYALAVTPPSPGTTSPGQNCSLNTAVVNGLGMDASRSFSMDQTNSKPTRPMVDVIIKLTDANTSITRFDTTCTVSHDGNTTDIVPQTSTVASGVATQYDSLKFQKASPGTKNWVVSFNLRSMPDFECTFSVGTGSGASADLLTVDVRMCAP